MRDELSAARGIVRGAFIGGPILIGIAVFAFAKLMDHLDARKS